jgi:hypothetical protein
VKPWVFIWHWVALQIAMFGLVLDNTVMALAGLCGLLAWVYYARKVS